MNIDVSIIIPVYNVAPYVEQCLNSVLNQTYDNIEIIVVDDCGTDESMAIVEKLKIEYNGPKVFRIVKHNCNSGLSSARNTGIKHSNGTWLYFLDSDDYISPECIESLLETSHVCEDLQMVVGAYEFVGNGEMNVVTMKDSTDVLLSNNKLECARLHCEGRIYPMAWNKLVRRDFVLKHKLFFVDGIWHEDEVWSFECMCLVSNIAIYNEVLYFYNIRDNSIQTSSNELIHLAHYGKAHCEILDFIHNHNFTKVRFIYDFLQNKIEKDFLYPLWNNAPQQSQCFFSEMRKCYCWSFFDLRKMHVSLYELLVPFIMLLPNNFSFKVYRRYLMHFKD